MFKSIIANWRQHHDRPLKAQIKTLEEQLQIERKKNLWLSEKNDGLAFASQEMQRECQALLTAICLNLKKIEVKKYDSHKLVKKYELLSEEKDGIVKIEVKKREKTGD